MQYEPYIIKLKMNLVRVIASPFSVP